MKRKLWTLIVVLLFIAILGWAFYPKATEVDIAALRIGRFERNINEDGKTRLRDRFVVSAPVAGKLARVMLREGDEVRQGQAVATLWPAAPALLDERRLLEQREQVAAAEASAQRAQTGISKAKVALAQADADLNRNESLAARGFISYAQIDNTRLNAQLKRKELDAAKQDADAAKHQLAQLRIALQQMSGKDPIANRPWAVSSPVAGKVLKIRQQSEAVLVVGTPLVDVGDPTQMEVLVELLTEDAAQVRPGAIATLAHWGGTPDLQARVRLVEPSAFTKVSALGVEEQRVNVLLDIVSPYPQWKALGDGYKVDVSIPVQSADNVTLVPVGCLFPQGSRSALFILEGGRARLKEVELLARNGKEAWIRTGLTPGTKVIAYPPSALKDGDRVKRLPH
jgi:HlyD family secretion protein